MRLGCGAGAVCEKIDDFGSTHGSPACRDDLPSHVVVTPALCQRNDGKARSPWYRSPSERRDADQGKVPMVLPQQLRTSPLFPPTAEVSQGRIVGYDSNRVIDHTPASAS